MTGKQTSPERPVPKSPIYSCEVIQTACMAIEALVKLAPALNAITPETHASINHTLAKAVDIIRDGLASQERSIKGETT